MKSYLEYEYDGGVNSFVYPDYDEDFASLEVTVNYVVTTFEITSSNPNLLTITGVTLEVGDYILIKRYTELDRIIDYASGSNLTSSNLNLDSNQIFSIQEELTDSLNLTNSLISEYRIPADSSNFIKNLSVDDNTIQKALETLDKMTLEVGSSISLDTTNFDNNLSVSDYNVQIAFQTLNDTDFAIDSDYIHTDNNYTTTEKDKLGLIEEEANKYVLPIDITFNKLLLTDEVRFQGVVSENTLMQKSVNAGRDEFVIYTNGSAYSTNSLGSGIHMYGNNDAQHAGNIAFLTGQSGSGDGRMIISGGSDIPTSEGYRTNTDTRITMGNTIWDFVDNGLDTGILNLKTTDGVKPALNFYDCINDIGFQSGNYFQIGGWDGTDYLNALTIAPAGGLRFYDHVVGDDNSKYSIFKPVFSSDGLTERLEIRTNSSVANGAGMDMKGNNDTEGGIIKFYTGGTLSLQINSTATKDVRAGSDNTQNLGTASTRWAEIYAGTGTINTSDDREKTYLTIEESETLVAKELKTLMRKFKFNDAIEVKGEEDARIHFGTSAQTVKSTFEKYGLVAEKYSLLCYNEWEEEKDEEGNITIEAGDRYGIRYEELLCFIISAI